MSYMGGHNSSYGVFPQRTAGGMGMQPQGGMPGQGGQMGQQQGGGSRTLSNFQGHDYHGEAQFDYNSAERSRYPINALTEVLGTNWFIKARVLDKQPVKQWNNARGSGHLLPMTLIDESGSAIRATFFKEGVDKYHNMLQVGQVYYFGNGRVRPAQKRFNTLPHDYEISFDQHAAVQPVQQADSSVTAIPQRATANWVTFRDLPDVETGKAVDIRCIIKSVEDVVTLQRKDGSGELQKRSVRVLDDSSQAAYEMTLWGEDALAFKGQPGQTLVSRSTRVGRFQDNVQLTGSGQIEIESDEAQHLRVWWDQGGSRQNFEVVGAGGSVRAPVTRSGFDQIEAREMGRRRDPDGKLKSDVLHIRGTVVAVSDKGAPYYIACPRERGGTTRDGRPMLCNKKLDRAGPDGAQLSCPVPGHGPVTNPMFRYIVQVRVSDHTGQQYVTLYDEAGQAILGSTAASLAEATHNDPEQATNSDAFMAMRQLVEWEPCVMTLGVREEEYDNKQRLKVTAYRGTVLRSTDDFLDDIKSLQRDIQRYQNEKH